jgi:hypothetical protein
MRGTLLGRHESRDEAMRAVSVLLVPNPTTQRSETHRAKSKTLTIADVNLADLTWAAREGRSAT